MIVMLAKVCNCLFLFNDTATTEIYTLSLHDALPISAFGACPSERAMRARVDVALMGRVLRAQRGFEPDESAVWDGRSEEHTSELQSRQYLVCSLLLEKKRSEQAGGLIIGWKENSAYE